MRISEQQRFNSANSKIEKARADNAQALDKLATQKEVSNISDAPQNLHKIFRSSANLSNIDNFQKNIAFSQGYLERTEAAIANITDNLIRAKELAIGLANDTNNAESRKMVVPEIEQLIQDVIASANTTYAERYVFSGFRINTPALSKEGIYNGDDGAIFLQTSDNGFQKINVQARQLFEASEEEAVNGHQGIIDCLHTLKHSLINNNKEELHRSISELDFQLGKMNYYRAEAGALQNSLSTGMNTLDLDKEHNADYLSKLRDADIFKTSSDFKRTDTILQSALTACNKMIEPSLLSVLK